jgi:uncharacterized protein
VEHGSSFAEAGLGLLYMLGQGVPNAQLSLGITYENGSGVKQDFDQAAFWYGKAAALGLEDAKKRLAGIEAKKKSQAK